MADPNASAKQAFEACKHGKLEELKLLLESDASLLAPTSAVAFPTPSKLINSVDENRNTLLHWACFSGFYEIAAYLLEQGINVDIANTTEDQTAIHWAVAGGRLRIIHALWKHSQHIFQHLDLRGYGLLHVAVQNGHLSVVHYLVLHGLSIHHRDKDGNTPLHWAAMKGDNNIARYLISAGADPNSEGSKGMTALHWSAALGHSEVLMTLVHLGDKVLLGVKDANGSTPLDLAMEKAQVRTTNLLKRQLARQADKYNLSDKYKALIGFFTTYGLNLLMVLGFTAGWPLVTLAVIAATIWSLRRQKERLYPDENSTNTVILGFFYCNFQMTVAAVIVWAWNDGFQARPLETLGYFVCIATAIFSHYSCVGSDAGHVPNDPATLAADVAELERDIELDRHITICSTCRVRKPVRAKHCKETNQCVIKFDHYCVWIGNAVGINNHRRFLLMLTTVVLAHWWSLRFLLYDVTWPASGNVTDLIGMVFTRSALYTYFVLFQTVNSAWECQLLVTQYLAVMRNLTMNESINMSHYTHFWNSKRGFVNPFTAGSYWKNVVEFLKGSGTDYYRLYYLDSSRSGGSAASTPRGGNNSGFRGGHHHQHGEHCNHGHEHV